MGMKKSFLKGKGEALVASIFSFSHHVSKAFLQGVVISSDCALLG